METRKYKKSRILSDWQIMSKGSLDEYIQRHSIKNIDDCIDIAKETINDGKRHDITLTPQYETQGQPVFNVQSTQELEQMRKKLKSMDLSPFCEIWHRRYKLEQMCGRQRFYLGDLFPRIAPSNVELLYGQTVRAVNEYPFGISDGFVNLEKADKSYPLKLTKSHIVTDKGKSLIDNIGNLNNAISQYQKRLIDFGQFVKGLGAGCVSFDFSFNPETSKIWFFDWDSDNDKSILSKMEHLGI